MSRRKLVFIVNPRSGVERNKQVQQAIDQIIDKDLYEYEILHTQRAGHGEDLAREAAANGVFAVVAVGGDGSVNDIIRGLYGTGTALAIIPKGSGNGLARALQIPMKVEKALQLINRGKTEMIDIGKANGKIFASNAGLGYDALICKKFANSNRRGLAIYSWLVTKYMWLYRDRSWTIRVNGEELKRKAFLINVANGTQMGYNFKIAPDADWTDGLFDLVIIRKFPKILGGLLAYRMFDGSLLNSRFVERIRTDRVEVSAPDLKWMQTDGDPVSCAETVVFEMLKGVQKVIIP
ncbi:diacylglycerol kinase family protein [Rurimicrobium arvi]|uniref:YegS/Rv2252/BmrU family lipid kinase n=1 Tax=Rurimicrobium arvi TaxID=2049916 RepID=A0ABP8MKD5_9BACT